VGDHPINREASVDPKAWADIHGLPQVPMVSGRFADGFRTAVEDDQHGTDSAFTIALSLGQPGLPPVWAMSY